MQRLFIVISLMAVTFSVRADADAQTQQAAPVIHRFDKPGPGSANTYWIETTHGIVVMDCQRELSVARAALREVQKAHKPVVAILITESHTDKLAGISLFAAAYPGVPIYASQPTIDTIFHDGKGHIRLTQKLLGPEYPAHVTPPNRVIHPGETLHLVGLNIQTRQLGPGEAPSHTLYYLPSNRALFSGDLILHDMTPFFLEEYSGPWLRRLEELGAAFPQARTLYPGHGVPGPRSS